MQKVEANTAEKLLKSTKQGSTPSTGYALYLGYFKRYLIKFPI